ncbi:MAG: PilZ domain-containing protein [Treponema sp.]|nr:PilZ domain-containing protein [Treponema sp.]
MNIFIVLLIVAVVVAAFVVVIRFGERREGGKKSSLLQFYAKGKDMGFGFKEIELLHRLAVKSNIEDPSVLFWSRSQLDNCIRSLIQSLRLAGTDQNPEIQEFLSKLYDYRKKLEIEKPKAKNTLISTRQVGESQNLRILVSGIGVFQSRLIKNTSQHITIARPTGPIVPRDFSWTGQRMAVYFWRDDDAGYVFDSDVLDEVYSRGNPALQIAHSDTLFRTQKRKSVRMKTHKPAYLYLQSRENSDLVEAVPGFKCILNDISDTGCAVTIGGKAAVGMRVKIQFVLTTAPMILCGVVRSVDYDEAANRSVLHIEAEFVPTETRNAILGEIFGMQEDEDALPVRITEEKPEKRKDSGVILARDPAADVELQGILNDNLM